MGGRVEPLPVGVVSRPRSAAAGYACPGWMVGRMLLSDLTSCHDSPALLFQCDGGKASLPFFDVAWDG